MRRRRASGSRRRRATPARSTEPIGRRSTVAFRWSARRAVEPAVERRVARRRLSPAVGRAEPRRRPAACRAGRARWRRRRPRTGSRDTAVTTQRDADPGQQPPAAQGRPALEPPGDPEAAEQARREQRQQPRVDGLERGQERPRPEREQLGHDAGDRRDEAQQGQDAEPDDRREGARRRGRPAARSRRRARSRSGSSR